jgi:hypothetical protein
MPNVNGAAPLLPCCAIAAVQSKRNVIVVIILLIAVLLIMCLSLGCKATLLLPMEASPDVGDIGGRSAHKNDARMSL